MLMLSVDDNVTSMATATRAPTLLLMLMLSYAMRCYADAAAAITLPAAAIITPLSAALLIVRFFAPCYAT